VVVRHVRISKDRLTCRLRHREYHGGVAEAEGHTVSLPDEVSKALEDRTDPLWPTTWFAPRLTGEGAFTSVYEVMRGIVKTCGLSCHAA